MEALIQNLKKNKAPVRNSLFFPIIHLDIGHPETRGWGVDKIIRALKDKPTTVVMIYTTLSADYRIDQQWIIYFINGHTVIGR